MKSKENRMLELFFNNPTKEWHFEEILGEAKITRSKASQWLRKFAKKKMIRRIKEKGKMPYYIAEYQSSAYQNRKKLFSLNALYECGFLDHLSSLPKAKAVIVFGSIVRWDWYKDSDIDLFVYGNPEGLDTTAYESKLHREIQLFICQDKDELGKLGAGLIRNIIKGSLVKGDLDFIKVNVNA